MVHAAVQIFCSALQGSDGNLIYLLGIREDHEAEGPGIAALRQAEHEAAVDARIASSAPQPYVIGRCDAPREVQQKEEAANSAIIGNLEASAIALPTKFGPENVPGQNRMRSISSRSSSSSSSGNSGRGDIAGSRIGTPRHSPNRGKITRHSAYDQAGRNSERCDAATRNVINGFATTDQNDIQLFLQNLLRRINFQIDIRGLLCCLKHASVQIVLMALRDMEEQRCDRSFMPFNCKQCTNCNLMAEEDEEFCFYCESPAFRKARRTIMSI